MVSADTSNDWQDAPMIFRELVACPTCSTAQKPIIIRTMGREPDGSYSRRCVCRKCSRRFVTVFEPPESLPETGKGENPTDTIGQYEQTHANF